MKKLYICIFLIMVSMSFSCWNPFDPDEDTPNEDTPPADRKEAKNCMEYMRQAYINLDIKKYEECLASDFTFKLLPTDWFEDENNEVITEWGKTTEIELTKKMFTSSSSIILNFYDDPDGHDQEENGEVLRIFNKRFDLTLYLKDNPGYGYAAFGQAEFALRKNSTSGLWEIVRWDDQSQSSGYTYKKGLINPVKVTQSEISVVGWHVKSFKENSTE